MIPENLIAKYLSNEASEEEIDQLYQWLASDTKHQKILSEYMSVYEERYYDEVKFDLDKGLKTLRDKVHPKRKAATFDFTMVYKVAAAILIVLLSMAVYYTYESFSTTAPALITQTNPPGKKSRFQLPDGSIVTLNAGSTIQYPETFTKNERNISLKGEAFFEVERDEQRPFRVYAGKTTTTVLGTSFNVAANADKLQVTVATGKVHVADNLGEEVFLTPGQMGVYENNEMTTREDVKLSKIMAWKDNVLVFEATDLSTFETSLEQWYGVSIDASEATANGCLFTGTFKNENVVNVLKAYAISTGIEYEMEGENVKLTGKGCE